MRLIQLYSNKQSFHTVTFKKGVNFVLGKPTAENKSNVQKTYNGVGKSLLVKLVDFCLACEPVEEFTEKIPNWEFTLEFELLEEKYTVSRNTSNQKKITLNGEEMSLENFKDIFKRKVFKLTEEIDYLTWRTLITRFTRPRKSSYNSFDKTYAKETDYSKLINTAYLLGLDVSLGEKKKLLKTEYDRVDELKKNIENDEIFKKYFTQGDDIDIEIIDLEEKIKSYRGILSSFQVSDSYYDIQKEAESLKHEAQDIKNKITLLNNTLRNVRKSLEIKTDISLEMVISLYKEAKQDFPEKVVKKVEEVNAFHHDLLNKRVQRLKETQQRTLNEISQLERTRKEISLKLDDTMKYLGEHKALDEFVAINDKMTTLTANLERLKSYKGLLQEYKNKMEEVEIDLKQENIITNNYLAEIYPIIEKNITTFRSLSKEFYDNKAGGIEIKTNEGKNQLRYNIGVHIDDDTSDGVNEVKIFCFDMTLLLTKHNHLMNFVFHDSRLYSNIDPRQVATLFRIAYEYTAKNDLQYIATVNQNQLDQLPEFYSGDQYKNYIEDNIILTLTDESEESKLLGVEVNMDYEK